MKVSRSNIVGIALLALVGLAGLVGARAVDARPAKPGRACLIELRAESAFGVELAAQARFGNDDALTLPLRFTVEPGETMMVNVTDGHSEWHTAVTCETLGDIRLTALFRAPEGLQ